MNSEVGKETTTTRMHGEREREREKARDQRAGLSLPGRVSFDSCKSTACHCFAEQTRISSTVKIGGYRGGHKKYVG